MDPLEELHQKAQQAGEEWTSTVNGHLQSGFENFVRAAHLIRAGRYDNLQDRDLAIKTLLDLMLGVMIQQINRYYPKEGEKAIHISSAAFKKAIMSLSSHYIPKEPV